MRHLVLAILVYLVGYAIALDPCADQIRHCRALMDAKWLAHCLSGPGECCDIPLCMRYDSDGDGAIDMKDVSEAILRRSAY